MVLKWRSHASLKQKKKIFKGLKGRGQFTAYRLGIPEFTEEGFG